MRTDDALGPMRMVEALADLASPNGVIGAMSSGLGSIAGNVSGGWEVYLESKDMLNIMMCSFAAGRGSDGRGLVVIAPEWAAPTFAASPGLNRMVDRANYSNRHALKSPRSFSLISDLAKADLDRGARDVAHDVIGPTVGSTRGRR